MAYYCLRRRHNGGGGVRLHSFLILAINGRSEVNSTPWPLYPQGRILYPLSKRLGGPTACLDIRESLASTGVQNLYLAACSIVTIAREQRLPISTSCMYNVLYIVCCYANSPRWYKVIFSIESACLADYSLNCLYLQLTPVLSNIITVILFTYQKVGKGTSQQVTAFVKRT
jgi:hypothetical protein